MKKFSLIQKILILLILSMAGSSLASQQVITIPTINIGPNDTSWTYLAEYLNLVDQYEFKQNDPKAQVSSLTETSNGFLDPSSQGIQSTSHDILPVDVDPSYGYNHVGVVEHVIGKTTTAEFVAFKMVNDPETFTMTFKKVKSIAISSGYSSFRVVEADGKIVGFAVLSIPKLGDNLKYDIVFAKEFSRQDFELPYKSLVPHLESQNVRTVGLANTA
jgi:hypothetical protein